MAKSKMNIEYYKSPIGRLEIIVDCENIIGVFLEGQKYYRDLIKEKKIYKNIPSHDIAREWLDKYFNGDNPKIDNLPLKLIGTPFRIKVWESLLKIPYGKTASYSEIAREIGHEKAMRAVGGAVAHNPLLIIVPCHRVVGADGKLGGFSAGIENKIKLLKHEGVNLC